VNVAVVRDPWHAGGSPSTSYCRQGGRLPAGRCTLTVAATAPKGSSPSQIVPLRITKRA
jgi:hypothetical protein